MKTTVDSDLTIDASEEAKICFTCDKKRCTPVSCKKLKQLKEEEAKNRAKKS